MTIALQHATQASRSHRLFNERSCGCHDRTIFGLEPEGSIYSLHDSWRWGVTLSLQPRSQVPPRQAPASEFQHACPSRARI